MRSYLNGLAVLIALMLTVSACDKKAATNDIAGSSSKTWKVEKLVNANGNRSMTRARRPFRCNLKTPT
jgi:hypothetical protein